MVRFISKPIITSQTIGERFVKTRQGGGWTLGYIARRIGVKANYLAAIEAGRYNELPGDIYALEFVKAYARVLRLDEREAMREYLAERAVQSVIRVKQTPARSIGFWFDWLKKYRAGLGKSLVGLIGLAGLALGVAGARGVFLPPPLEVFSPTAYYEATGSLVVLSGQTEVHSSIFINNEAIFVDERGAFNETINLPLGLTLLKIVAKNSRGQEQVVYRTVNAKPRQARLLRPSLDEARAGQVAGAGVKRGESQEE